LGLAFPVIDGGVLDGGVPVVVPDDGVLDVAVDEPPVLLVAAPPVRLDAAWLNAVDTADATVAAGDPEAAPALAPEEKGS
jgi:hypothetical protein